MNKKDYSRPLNLKKIKITDSFWGRAQELVRTEVIPYQWEALNDRVPDAAPSYCMRNFKTAGRLMKEKREKGAAFVPPAYTFRGFEALPEDPGNPDPDKFYGFVFQDSDFAKWIEAVGYSLINHPDPELERAADEAIDVVCAAQAENGYLDTYYIINGMDRIFTNLRSHHELYCFGHLTEGAISYAQATGKDKLLKAAMRYADFICTKFGPEEGKCKGYPGHEIAEMALARLYELTGEEKYLDLACFFLDMRGRKPYYFDAEEKERADYEGRPYKEPGGELRYMYHQAHMPVREQSEAVGHAVRAVYLYSGMADIARLKEDEEMFAACKRLWDSITKEKLYITGGIGGTHIEEAFSFPYDLPNDTAYSETCAAIGLAFFARRMLEIEADSRYGDCMELALYNTVPAGMALDGKSFFYVNPLEVLPEACKKDPRKRHVTPIRQKWFGCACCPPNIARIVSSLGAYIYTRNEDTLYTHLYVGSELSLSLGGRDIDVKTESSFPWDGDVRFTIHTADGTAHGTFAFRIPGWCRTADVKVYGRRQADIDTDSKEYGRRTDKDMDFNTYSRQRTDKDMDFNTYSRQRTDLKMDTDSMRACYKIVRNSPEDIALSNSIRLEGNNCLTENTCLAENFSAGNPLNQPTPQIQARIWKGYLYLTGDWKDKDEIRLALPMEIRCVSAHTNVREDIGRAAFTRGPVCYCMEEIDNGKNLPLLRVDWKRLMPDLAGAAAETSTKLGHEMRILKIPGLRQAASCAEAALYNDYAPAEESAVTLTLVPYYAWNNRGEGEMSVWVRI